MAMLHLILSASTLAFNGPLSLNKIRTSKPPIFDPGRRELCRAFGLGFTAFGLLPSQVRAVDEEYKDLATKVTSKLLTSAETVAESKDALGAVDWGAPKVTGLSTEEMAKRVDAGLRRECWFVTGRSLPELFSNSFTFSDPQVSLTGIEEYSRGVRSFYKQGYAVGEIVCTEEDAFEVNNADLLKYNLPFLRSKRPAVPPIDSVACPLPKKA